MSWAQTPDRAARTAPARAGLEAKFLAEADGDPVRAAHIRTAYYTRLAIASAAARRRATLLTATTSPAEPLTRGGEAL